MLAPIRHDALAESGAPDRHYAVGDVGRRDREEALELSRERVVDAVLIAGRRADGDRLALRAEP